ncbi:restriction endonuclease subunit S [Erwinia endophytica]|uniref:restriction endonuclease subunit S n=1 Tax=Erwinia endophytica TaxID=1563158 RepID=UPI001265D827|nr:restriction endonuclease subunit S [Erwinia endophytica]KAB8311641.1 restriction endonuclease subunit S [Erwinia endophytica]
MSELSYLEKLLDGVAVEWLPLGKLGELVRGSGLPKSVFTESGIPAIHYGQIYTFYGLSTETTKSFVSLQTAEKLKKVNTGDVVITNTSENFADVGKALVYLGAEQAVTGGHATIFKPNIGVIGKYFAYFTQTDSFAIEKRKYSKGTKVIDVSATDMAKITVPIPCPDNPEKSLAIQSEIVRILDTFTALTAELTAELTMRKKQYNYYRDQLLSFTESEVEWKTLLEACDYVDYRGKTPKKTQQGIFLVTAKNIRMGYIDYETSQEFISEADYADVMRRGLPNKGDVLITTEAPCGFVAQVDRENIALAQRVIKYRSKNIKLSNSFLKHYLLGCQFQDDLMRAATGSTVKGIKGSKLHQLKIPIPSEVEQARIVAILDKFDTLTNSIAEGLPREIELRQKQYEYYRDLLFSFPKPEEVEA